MKKIIFIILIAFSIQLSAQEAPSINWLTIEEAQEAMKTQKKKIFIDLYTDWCGWCKKMDASTFKDANVVQFMNQYYYAVKFNAEQKDSVNFNNFGFYNLNPGGKRGTHLFAYSLLDGQMSYPSYALLDENMSRIHVIAGYKQTTPFASILLFFGTDQYKHYHNYVVKQIQQNAEQTTTNAPNK
ncbi:MAG: thioredoxin-related protein [Salibacteraceae bacterium]|jgi:thioredoxin-related protein